MTDKPKRAIVLDDEPMVRYLLEKVVSQCGYSVASYSSPADLAIFKEPVNCPSVTGDWASFDTNPNGAELIITDMRMPFYSGLEYTTKLREVGCKVRHIAMVSGDLSTDDRIEAEALGCKVFYKPFNTSEMKEWILSLEY
jgi:CheY-like chemotaxis protein